MRRSRRLSAVLFAMACSAGIARAQCLWEERPDPAALNVTVPALKPIVFDGTHNRILYLEYTNNPALVTRGWDHTRWQTLSALGPSGRFGFKMVWDSARNVVVFYGGGTDTWEWSGAGWVQRMIAGPGFRDTPALVYDSVRARTVLFGGVALGNIYSGQTWEYDGASWVLRSSEGPSARWGPAAAFDADRGVTVLFGGEPPTGYAADTWEWDGSAWSMVPGPGPSARCCSAMIYDPVNHRCVLYAGYDNHPAGDETWVFDGTVWTRLATGTPPRETSSVMAWDPSLGRGVLLQPGGFSSSGYSTELWLYDPQGSVAAPVIAVPPRPVWTQIGMTAAMAVTAQGCPTLRYQWMRDGVPVANSARVSGATLSTLLISPVRAEDAGEYCVEVVGPYGAVQSPAASLVIDPCYANCDASTALPVLNVLDFACFMTRFTQGDEYANCDGATSAPVFNVNDFVCFQRRFVAGCP